MVLPGFAGVASLLRAYHGRRARTRAGAPRPCRAALCRSQSKSRLCRPQISDCDLHDICRFLGGDHPGRKLLPWPWLAVDLALAAHLLRTVSAKQRLSRRRFLRRSMLAVWGLSTTASVAGELYMLYPNLAGQFGSALPIGQKSAFPAAKPSDFKINEVGVFYHPEAKTYVAHLAKDTQFSLKGSDLADQLSSEFFVKDKDGSFWVALYQRCVHLGCTVPFRNDCVSFKCPCHGSHSIV